MDKKELLNNILNFIKKVNNFKKTTYKKVVKEPNLKNCELMTKEGEVLLKELMSLQDLIINFKDMPNNKKQKLLNQLINFKPTLEKSKETLKKFKEFESLKNENKE